jgi:cell division septation protein DedD
LQIGAFTSEAFATAAWTTFRTRYGDVAANASENIQKVDLGAKGTWYRLRIGPYASKDAASGACAKLKSEGGNCFVSAQ